MKGKNCCILLVVFCFLLSSCASTNVFDKDFPPEKSAKLIIASYLNVKTYNGIPVDLTPGVGNTGFTIPAGRTELTFDINAIIRARNVSLAYNFAAGNEYALRGVFIDKEGNIKTAGGGYFGVVLIQGNDVKKPLLMITFDQNEKTILD